MESKFSTRNFMMIDESDGIDVDGKNLVSLVVEEEDDDEEEDISLYLLFLLSNVDEMVLSLLLVDDK